MPKQISLVNAVQTSEDYNLRQPPPNYQQIAELTPEDYVKLKTRGEYFWVKVDAVDPYVGIVMDDPVFNQKFQKGDKIYFEDVNVFDLRAKEWLNNEGI